MKTALTILGGIATFSLTAALVLHFMPNPMKASDYFVAGSVGTMSALLVVFLVVVGPRLKSGDVFFKKRPKQK